MENDLEKLRNWNEGLANVVPEEGATDELGEGTSIEETSSGGSKRYNSDSPNPNDKDQEDIPSLGKNLTQAERQLLFQIQKYKRAEKICKEAGIKLSDLRERYAFLVYKLKKYIEIEGLYQETSPVRLIDHGIQISRDHLIESGFEVGDRFKISFKDRLIVLSRLQGSEG
jgi:hypothetical protein